jgi:hypothetical protein
MVTQLQPDVRAYLHGGEVIKRYISYVDETGDAHEKYNFTPVNMEGREGLYYIRFVKSKA